MGIGYSQEEEADDLGSGKLLLVRKMALVARFAGIEMMETGGSA